MQELSLVALRRQVAKDSERAGDVEVVELLEEVPRPFLSQPALLGALNAGGGSGGGILGKVDVEPSGVLRLVLGPSPVDLAHRLWVEGGPFDEHEAIVLNFQHHLLALPVLEDIVEELAVDSLELVLVERGVDLRAVVKVAQSLARHAKHRAVSVHDLLEQRVLLDLSESLLSSCGLDVHLLLFLGSLVDGMLFGLFDALLSGEGCRLHQQCVKLGEKGVPEQRLDLEIFSNLGRNGLEIEQLLLLLLEVTLEHLKLILL